MSAGSASPSDPPDGTASRTTRRIVAGLVLLTMALVSASCTSESKPRPTFILFQSRGGDSFEWSEAVFGRSDCRSIAITVNGSSVNASLYRNGERFQAQVPIKAGANAVVAQCGSGVDAPSSDTLRFDQKLTGTAAANHRVDLPTEPPTWLGRAVVYAPVSELWGDDAAVTVQRRLPYLKRLGVNVLWLWPPVSSSARGEEYAITDYFEVDEAWGSKHDLQELIAEAHGLGMRVIVDFVPNHMSRRSTYLRDSATHGRASAYWDLFDRDKSGRPTYYFDWAHLPNLNFDNREVRNMIIEASKYWVTEMDVDGFRMDVAWGVRRRNPAFWHRLTRVIGGIDPEVMLLAGASARAPYYFRSGFDVAYDWAGELGHWAWAKAFEKPARTGVLLRRALAAVARSEGLVLRFINNNDTGRRFVDRYGPELTKVAATLQFTVPGMPAMFAGDEIGASFDPYTELDPIPWTDDHGLRPFYKRLIEVRLQTPALASDRIVLLETNNPATLAFIRGQTGGKQVLVALNFGDAADVRISGRALAPVPTEMTDLLTANDVGLARSGGSVTISMQARSPLVITP